MITSPRMSQIKVYQYKFQLHVSHCKLQAQPHCTYFLCWRTGDKSVTSPHSIAPVSDTIPFNTTLRMNLDVAFDEDLQVFREKKTVLCVNINTHEKESRLVGTVSLDVSTCLNTNDGQELTTYYLQKCIDKSSSIMLSIRGEFVQEITNSGISEYSQSPISDRERNSVERPMRVPRFKEMHQRSMDGARLATQYDAYRSRKNSEQRAQSRGRSSRNKKYQPRPKSSYRRDRSPSGSQNARFSRNSYRMSQYESPYASRLQQNSVQRKSRNIQNSMRQQILRLKSLCRTLNSDLNSEYIYRVQVQTQLEEIKLQNTRLREIERNRKREAMNSKQQDQERTMKLMKRTIDRLEDELQDKIYKMQQLETEIMFSGQQRITLAIRVEMLTHQLEQIRVGQVVDPCTHNHIERSDSSYTLRPSNLPAIIETSVQTELKSDAMAEASIQTDQKLDFVTAFVHKSDPMTTSVQTDQKPKSEHSTQSQANICAYCLLLTECSSKQADPTQAKLDKMYTTLKQEIDKVLKQNPVFFLTNNDEIVKEYKLLHDYVKLKQQKWQYQNQELQQAIIKLEEITNLKKSWQEKNQEQKQKIRKLEEINKAQQLRTYQDKRVLIQQITDKNLIISYLEELEIKQKAALEEANQTILEKDLKMELKHYAKKLTDQNHQSENIIRDLSGKVIEHQIQKKGWTGQIEKKDHQIQILRKQTEQYQKRLSQEKAEIIANTQLNTKNDKKSEDPADSDKILRVSRQLRKRLGQCETKEQNYKKQIQALRQRNNLLSKHLKKFQVKISRQQKTIEELSMSISASVNASLNVTLKDDQNFTEERAIMQEQITHLISYKQKLEDQKQELQNITKIDQIQRQKLENDNAQLKNKIKDLQSRLKSHRQQSQKSKRICQLEQALQQAQSKYQDVFKVASMRLSDNRALAQMVKLHDTILPSPPTLNQSDTPTAESLFSMRVEHRQLQKVFISLVMRNKQLMKMYDTIYSPRTAAIRELSLEINRTKVNILNKELGAEQNKAVLSCLRPLYDKIQDLIRNSEWFAENGVEEEELPHQEEEV